MALTAKAEPLDMRECLACHRDPAPRLQTPKKLFASIKASDGQLPAPGELAARYRGSLLGFLWTLLTPIVMIAIFTMIFAGIFKAKFGASSSQWDYALYLFCGLLPWNAFQESLQLSSSTIVSHANLVKRVVFPLETLPVSLSLAAIVNQLFGTAVLLVAAAIMRPRPLSGPQTSTTRSDIWRRCVESWSRRA